jgi:hypothetical protein
VWDFLEAVENGAFASFVRETPSVLGYSTVLAFHTVGMAFLVGLSGVIALRVLGMAPALPLAPLKKFFPLIILGFWINAATGVVLTMLAAISLLSNPDFYVKLVAIVGALISLQALRRHAFGELAVATKPAPMKARLAAASMLLCWGIAVTAGRLTAYSAYVGWRTATAVVVATLVLLTIRIVVVRAWRGSRPSDQAGPITSVNC